MRTDSRIDRLPPHSPEAELGVLGCALIDPNDVLPRCIERIKADSFYDLRHQTIYSTLIGMYDERVAIDLITIHQRLKDAQLLEQVGGLTYLSTLPDATPSTSNLDYYLDILREKYLLRKTIHACTDAVAKIYDHEGNVDALLDGIEGDILKISQDRASKESLTICELVRSSINRIEDYHKNQGKIDGIATGFTDFDRMTFGLHGGEMIVIAARPSVGKTSLAMNIADDVAINQKLPVGVFSLEMTAESLTMRMICSRARVNVRNVRDGFLAERDFPKLTIAAGSLSKAPLFIDDSSGLSILQLRAKARRMHQQHGVKLFVIDYLQLLHSTSRKAENRQQEITDISSGIKSLAKDLNVPVIVLSQLNRDIEKEKNRKPRLSDLRESGSIEQDADLVGLLYRPNTPDEDESNNSLAIPVNLLIAKQRNGDTGDVPLTFFKQYTRFESAAKVSDEDIPN